MRPLREVLLQELQRLRVGVCRPILPGLQSRVGADDDEGPQRITRELVTRLLADPVQARGDMLQRGDEGARTTIRRRCGWP